QLARHASRCTAHALGSRAQRVDHAARRLVHPAARLAQQRERAAALGARLARAWRGAAAADHDALIALASRLLREARAPLPQRALVLRQAELLRRAARDVLARRSLRVESAARAMAHLNPRAVLTRGYA